MKLEAIVNHETSRIHSTCIVVSRAQAQHLHKAQAFKQLRHVMLHIALLHCSKLFIINNKYNYFSLFRLERERERARIFYIHWVTGLWRHLLSDKSSYCKEMAQ